MRNDYASGSLPSHGPVESIDRALRVISLLAERGEGWSLDDLAVASGLPKSTLHRVLGALRHRGFAGQPEPNGPYLLGAAALEAAFGFHDRLDVRVLAGPLLALLAREFSETVHLAVLDGADVVYVDKRESTHPVRMSSTIGGRNPAHATGVGKALLSVLLSDDDDVHDWVDRHGPLSARTVATVTSADELARQLRRVRTRGYATDVGENELGVHCVAVPLVLAGREPVGAVSVTAPKARLPRSRLDETAAEVRAMVLASVGAVAVRPFPPVGARRGSQRQRP